MSQVPFGFTPGDGQQPFDLSNMGAMLQQLGAMMQRAQQVPVGAVDWEGVRNAARARIALTSDPSPVEAQEQRVRDAGALAQLWLDSACEFPAASHEAAAWSRAQWFESTFAAWQPLVEPIALSMAATVKATTTQAPADLPPELQAMLGPMMQMASQISTVMVAQQIGQALGALAVDVWSASDIGIPLTADGATALVVTNVEEFASGLSLEVRDVETYVAVREAAAQRLFAATPWLRPRLQDALREYAQGVSIDTERMRALVEDMDLNDPASLQQAMQSGALELPLTAGQESALARVELLITLIEGWVDEVTHHAVGGRIGREDALREALRRRRASGGPSERVFSQLIGLELRPRKLREAAALWSLLEPAKRDALWAHPDFLPDFADLEHPAEFIARSAE